MTGVEIFRLVLETLGAIGAIGGVGIGLWAMLRKKPPFAIRAIEVTSHTTTRTGAMRATGPAHEVSHSLILKIENFRDTKIQVFGVDIDADHSKSKKHVHMMGMGLAKPDVFIPEKSIYEIEYKLDSKSVVGTYSQAKDILVTVRTSFGDTTISFPKEWHLAFFQATEEPWPFNSPSPFEQTGLKRAV
ncbi:MAG: hypothetical protein IPO54_01975 [Micavibrio sp.]|nr:hypothetical protein [Micavibrio sp.]